MKPLIGITCSSKCMEKTANFTFSPQQFHYLGEAYANAVAAAGGIPVILPSLTDPEQMEAMADRLDGLVFSGGPDIDPALYGQRIITGVGPVDINRDAAELALYRYVKNSTSLPVLAICRGIQLINAADGGDLYQDLKAAGKGEHRLSMFPRCYPSHEVRLVPGSQLARIEDCLSMKTNSFHHQAVKTPAPGWVVTATSPEDGVIEAMEKPGSRFMLAVQWHPEAMPDNEPARRLFRALVEAAR